MFVIQGYKGTKGVQGRRGDSGPEVRNPLTAIMLPDMTTDKCTSHESVQVMAMSGITMTRITENPHRRNETGH